MPKELERKLRKEAEKKGLKGERADAYVFGTMQKLGWRPSSQTKKAKQPTRRRRKPK